MSDMERDMRAIQNWAKQKERQANDNDRRKERRKQNKKGK